MSLWKMINIHAKVMNGAWFGLACAADGIVATSIGLHRQEVLRGLSRSLPPGAKHQVVEECPESVEETMVMLREIESGNETNKSFSLSGEYVPAYLSRVLNTAASVPIGYVTSYGNIAKASDSEPRLVGKIMASNPLYPLVPCHRVVGADLSLVGYRGGKDMAMLQAKLERLRGEARGYSEPKEVRTGEGKFEVYPVEWAIRKASPEVTTSSCQRKLFE
jgi:O-6-methylguanine DNA methyltransferase